MRIAITQKAMAPRKAILKHERVFNNLKIYLI